MTIKHSYADNDRRFKIVYIHPHILLNCLVNNSRLPGDSTTKVSLDVPDGTVVVDRYYDCAHAAEGIVLYNKQWDSIPLGEQIPQLYITSTFTTVKLDQPNDKITQPINPDLFMPGNFERLLKAASQNPPVWEQGQPVRMVTRVTDRASGKTEETITELKPSYDPEKQETKVTNPTTGAFNIIKDIHLQRMSVVQSVSEKALNQISKSLEEELFDPNLGIPNEQRMARLDETWRDKPPLL